MDIKKRRKIVKILDLVIGIPMTIVLVLWMVGGTVFILVSTFVGSALTLGLAGWPIFILGALVFWALPLAVGYFLGGLAQKAGEWYTRPEVDPERLRAKEIARRLGDEFLKDRAKSRLFY